MIRKCVVLFCDNEHGTGHVTFPDLERSSVSDLEQALVDGNTIKSLRADAKKIGWGRVNGGDYCPGCMESM